MSLAWFNGDLVPLDRVAIDPADRGFLLGDGLFETLRAQNGAALHADRHLARLRAGATVLGLALPWAEPALLDAIDAVLRAFDQPDAAVRLTLTRGPAPRGVLPPENPGATCLITAGRLPPPLPPARVVIATVTRRNEHSPLSRLKTLNYLDSILARREAARLGADDAVLLNGAGRIAEATASNVFVTIDGETLTPPVADGALPGIARALLLESGAAIERAMTCDDVGRAHSAFLANSLQRREIGWLSGRKLQVKEDLLF